MKCPMCDGRRTMFTREQPGVGTQFGEIKLVVCPKCNGTGEVDENSRPILTNEEWLQQASTEEKALFLARLYGHSRAIELSEMLFYNVGTRNVADVADYIGKWLKEEHDD